MVSWVLSIRPQSCLLTKFPVSISKSKLLIDCLPRSVPSRLSVPIKRQSAVKTRCFSETKRRTPSVQSKRQFWEDPDDGSDSEGEEEEGIGNDLDFESDWEEGDSRAQKVTAVNNYEEQLARGSSFSSFTLARAFKSVIFVCVFAEVEQLLAPEERAILQQNEKPNLQMISTKKWKPLQTLALSMQIQLMDNLMDNGLDIDDVDK
ncbi:hypothetical protein F2Q70_00027363, partial [Brassica cretica]